MLAARSAPLRAGGGSSCCFERRSGVRTSGPSLERCASLPSPNSVSRVTTRRRGQQRGTALCVHAMSKAASPVYIGLDFGTSGARVTVIDDSGATLFDAKRSYGENALAAWAKAWEEALWALLEGIAFDGTSATAMLLDTAAGEVIAPPLLYNDPCPEALPALKRFAPEGHTVLAATSTLAKLATWHSQGAWKAAKSPALLHQADWLAYLLHGRSDVSDWNNALKVGFDPGAEAYPEWLLSRPYAPLLPRTVLAPGAPAGLLLPSVSSRLGLPLSCVVGAGTTDSIAAFLAAGVDRPGQAVTSLGSTLAVKLLSTTRVDSAAQGVYSHRLGDTWLVGGASNTGGAVLRSLFSDAQLRELSAKIDPAVPSKLDYYPLVKPGERFPVNDPNLQPRLAPRPEDDALFLGGVLEGIARIEGMAFKLLTELGATPVTEVFTAGGGAQNPQWTAIRQRVLGVPVKPSPQTEAAYGAAILARQAAQKHAGAGPAVAR